MKLRIVCLVIVFFSVVLSMHATSCNQDTVNGTYAKSAIGQLGKGYGAVVFLATNNAGSFSGVGAENFNGTPYTHVTESGTYTVNANCTFTSTTTDSNGNTIHFSGNIFGNGDEMVGISTDAGSAYQLTSYRLKKTQCTEASAKGSFVEDVQWPITPYGPAIQTAQLTVSSKGAESGSFVANVNNGTIESNTFTGTISMNSDCTFTTTEYTSGGGPTLNLFGVGGISQNGVASLLIEIDSGWVGLFTRY
ncbi:MAG TPA: hypothetical protein VJX30_18270 [Terriglobales bacterium]|jgi:hypothetical protein|nr:hypothetical protein [Terriglobales bacterium]